MNNWEVVKASSGHYPQPFLISILWKNLPTGPKDCPEQAGCGKDSVAMFRWQILFTKEAQVKVIIAYQRNLVSSPHPQLSPLIQQPHCTPLHMERGNAKTRLQRCRTGGEVKKLNQQLRPLVANLSYWLLCLLLSTQYRQSFFSLKLPSQQKKSPAFLRDSPMIIVVSKI